MKSSSATTAWHDDLRPEPVRERLRQPSDAARDAVAAEASESLHGRLHAADAEEPMPLSRPGLPWNPPSGADPLLRARVRPCGRP